jgi:hypothetical protein
MDRTLLRSRKSSSSCSRIDGVIRERTISVRFSRLMKKKTPAESTRRGRRCPQKTGGGSAAGSNSCGLPLFLDAEVHRQFSGGVGPRSLYGLVIPDALDGPNRHAGFLGDCLPTGMTDPLQLLSYISEFCLHGPYFGGRYMALSRALDGRGHK